MGQSLSNLCGIKPADPPQWAAFEAKMKAEGLSEAAIAAWLGAPLGSVRHQADRLRVRNFAKPFAEWLRSAPVVDAAAEAFPR